MRAKEWRRYIRDTLDGHNPSLEDYGKGFVCNRPSRVRDHEHTENRYWCLAEHVQIRSPADWTKADWEFELQQVRKLCKDPDREGESIFVKLLKRRG